MKKIILLTLLMSLTFAQSNLRLDFIFGHNRQGHNRHQGYKHRHHHGCGHGNHYNYGHRYWSNHSFHRLFNQMIWLSYYNNHNQSNTDEKKTDAQILEDIEKLYVLYEQGAISEAEYNELKKIMLEEIENN